MRKILLKLNKFHVIFVVFGIFFSSILFLSIPSLFDYQKLRKIINYQIESEFNFYIVDGKNIKYRFFPSPHLLIENSSLILETDDNSKISDIKSAEIYISLFKLYKKQIEIKKIKISNINLNFNNKTFNQFMNHLNTKRIKNLFIDKSKFFYFNSNNEATTIALIKNLNYLINPKTNQKKLKINGKLFDTNFNFNWVKVNVDNSEFEFNFTRPNIRISNTFTKIDKINSKGEYKINFLNKKIENAYLFDGNKIFIESNQNKIDNFFFNGNLILDPFFFDINATINRQNINTVLTNILNNFFNYKENIHQNLNGKLKLDFPKIDNAYFNKASLKFNISDKKISLKESKFNVRNIGFLEIKKNFFYNSEDQVYFVSQIEVTITNQEEFYRRFSVPIKNRKNLDKIFMIIEKNIDKDIYAIHDISLDQNSSLLFDKDNLISLNKLYFDNFQKFRNIIKNEFKKF